MSRDERISGQAHDQKDLEFSVSDNTRESMCLAVSALGGKEPRMNAGQRGAERKRPIDLWELFCLPDCSRLSPSIVHDRPGSRAIRRLDNRID
jgi:hypothetical protein